jgi:hypothetical protein
VVFNHFESRMSCSMSASTGSGHGVM